MNKIIYTPAVQFKNSPKSRIGDKNLGPFNIFLPFFNLCTSGQHVLLIKMLSLFMIKFFRMFHDTFLKCLKLPDNSRLEGILNVCLLLPPLHISTLSSLLRFLSEVVKKSPLNKMGARCVYIDICCYIIQLFVYTLCLHFPGILPQYLHLACFPSVKTSLISEKLVTPIPKKWKQLRC